MLVIAHGSVAKVIQASLFVQKFKDIGFYRAYLGIVRHKIFGAVCAYFQTGIEVELSHQLKKGIGKGTVVVTKKTLAEELQHAAILGRFTHGLKRHISRHGLGLHQRLFALLILRHTAYLGQQLFQLKGFSDKVYRPGLIGLEALIEGIHTGNKYH